FPKSALTLAQLAFNTASTRIKSLENRWWLTGKFKTARCVDAPYSEPLGTSIAPMESFSVRNSAIDPPSCIYPLVPFVNICAGFAFQAPGVEFPTNSAYPAAPCQLLVELTSSAIPSHVHREPCDRESQKPW